MAFHGYHHNRVYESNSYMEIKSMAKKSQTTSPTSQIDYELHVDPMADNILAYYPADGMDDDRFRYNEVSGEDNPRYQADDKYSLGGVVAQYAWMLTNKRPYFNAKQAQRLQAEREWGTEDPRTVTLQEQETRVQNKIEFYTFLFNIHKEMFERLCDLTWGEGHAATEADPHHQQWWVEYKERMSDRKVLAPKATEGIKRLQKRAS